MTSLFKLLLLSLLLLAAWAPTACGQILQGPVEPSAEETVALEAINRGRADPQADAQRCLQSDRAMGEADHDAFVREMQEVPPCAPVFFDTRLILSARRHSHYQVLHDVLSHDENPQLELFTGIDCIARAQNAGWPNRLVGENIASDYDDGVLNHMAFVVDSVDSGTPDGSFGMQAGRGHRVNTFHPMYRLVGIGFDLTRSAKTTYNFGGVDQRFIGGVIYFDADSDEFYDPGEGIGGSLLSTGTQTVAGFQSGAFTLPVGSGGGQVVMQVATLTLTRPYPAGDANYKVDFILSEEEMQVLRDLRAEQDHLVYAVRSRNVRDATSLMQSMSRTYRDTPVAAWCGDADIALDMRKIYIDTADRIAAGQQLGQSLLERKLRQLTRLQEKFNTPEWAGVGMEIGEAFIALGQSGTINQDLICELGLEEEEEPLAPMSGFNTDGSGAPAASPFAGRTVPAPAAPTGEPATGGTPGLGQFGEPAEGAVGGSPTDD